MAPLSEVAVIGYYRPVMAISLTDLIAFVNRLSGF